MKFSLTLTTPEIEQTVPVALLEGSFESRLEQAAELGYDGVELMTARPADLDAAAIHAQIERLGLEVSAISSGAQASLEKVTLLADAESGLRRLEELARFAKLVGAPLVTIGSFKGRLAGQGSQAGFSQLVDVFARAAQIAEDHAIRLVIEPLNRYETDVIYSVGEGLDLIDAVRQQNEADGSWLGADRQLGLLVDVFHANIEEVSLRNCLLQAAAADRLWHVHIADSNRLAPGQGHLDFPEIFRTLAELNYQGYCSAELLAEPDPTTAAVQTIAYCKAYR